MAEKMSRAIGSLEAGLLAALRVRESSHRSAYRISAALKRVETPSGNRI